MYIRKLFDYTCKFCHKKFKSRQYFQTFCSHRCYVDSKRINPSDKFKFKVDKKTGCWIWNYGIASNSTGYGQIAVNGRCMGAHRFSWITHNGAIPKGKHVLHKCDVRMCVNPKHLFLGTMYDNMGDASKKGRMPRGERNNMHKLTMEKVLSIRKEYIPFQVTMKFLGKKYGVTSNAIHHIIHRKNWRHI